VEGEKTNKTLGLEEGETSSGRDLNKITFGYLGDDASAVGHGGLGGPP